MAGLVEYDDSEDEDHHHREHHSHPHHRDHDHEQGTLVSYTGTSDQDENDHELSPRQHKRFKADKNKNNADGTAALPTRSSDAHSKQISGDHHIQHNNKLDENSNGNHNNETRQEQHSSYQHKHHPRDGNVRPNELRSLLDNGVGATPSKPQSQYPSSYSSSSSFSSSSFSSSSLSRGHIASSSSSSSGEGSADGVASDSGFLRSLIPPHPWHFHARLQTRPSSPSSSSSSSSSSRSCISGYVCKNCGGWCGCPGTCSCSCDSHPNVMVETSAPTSSSPSSSSSSSPSGAPLCSSVDFSSSSWSGSGDVDSVYVKGEECDVEVVGRFAKYLEMKNMRGLVFLDELNGQKDFHNPCILDKVATLYDISQHHSNFPIDIFNPVILPQDHYHAIEKQASQEEELRRSMRTSIEFVGSTSDANSSASGSASSLSGPSSSFLSIALGTSSSSSSVNTLNEPVSTMAAAASASRLPTGTAAAAAAGVSASGGRIRTSKWDTKPAIPPAIASNPLLAAALAQVQAKRNKLLG